MAREKVPSCTFGLTTLSPPPSPLQYDYLVREKVADGALIAKWRKPGYEILCSMLAIQRGNHNFGTTSHCRVPLKVRGDQQRITPDVQTGCISCASGDGRFGGPIWWVLGLLGMGTDVYVVCLPVLIGGGTCGP